MMREQFTFYRSYFDAIREIRDPRERAALYDAIANYALYEKEANGLKPIAAALFSLIKPTLDSGRKKAANGRRGGKANDNQNENKTEANAKQTESKTEANGKQTESE